MSLVPYLGIGGFGFEDLGEALEASKLKGIVTRACFVTCFVLFILLELCREGKEVYVCGALVTCGPPSSRSSTRRPSSRKPRKLRKLRPTRQIRGPGESHVQAEAEVLKSFEARVLVLDVAGVRRFLDTGE